MLEKIIIQTTNEKEEPFFICMGEKDMHIII